MRNISLSKYFIIFIIISMIFFGLYFYQLRNMRTSPVEVYYSTVEIYDNNTTYFYIIYSEPTDVSTSVFVDGKLIIKLSDFTFRKYPPVSEYAETNLTDGWHEIEIYEKKYGLSKIETIYINEKRVIEIFIDIENKFIDIRALQNKPNFE